MSQKERNYADIIFIKKRYSNFITRDLVLFKNVGLRGISQQSQILVSNLKLKKKS